MLIAHVLAALLVFAQPARPQHVVVQPDAIEWRGAAGGLQTAIAEGNPQRPGLFTMMLKLPDGVWIPPHFHNVEKRLVVISGKLLLGQGDTLDAATTTALPAGGVAVIPANTNHYEGGKGETIVALIALGPFTTTMLKEPGAMGSSGFATRRRSTTAPSRR